MKKIYKSPDIRTLDEEKNWAPAAALAAGYAVGRAVAKAMDVRSLKACISLPKGDKTQWCTN